MLEYLNIPRGEHLPLLQGPANKDLSGSAVMLQNSSASVYFSPGSRTYLLSDSLKHWMVHLLRTNQGAVRLHDDTILTAIIHNRPLLAERMQLGTPRLQDYPADARRTCLNLVHCW